MHLENNPLAELAQRVRRDDTRATEEFRLEMGLALEGMVRLALRKRACFNPFEEYARAKAERLQASSGLPLPSHELARQTAGQVCQEIIGRLQAGGRIHDTVAEVGVARGSLMYQTILGLQWQPAVAVGRDRQLVCKLPTAAADCRLILSPAALKEKRPL
jgi:hypothetical protein